MSEEGEPIRSIRSIRGQCSWTQRQPFDKFAQFVGSVRGRSASHSTNSLNSWAKKTRGPLSQRPPGNLFYCGYEKNLLVIAGYLDSYCSGTEEWRDNREYA